MRFLVFIFALIVVSNCSQVDKIRLLLKTFDYTDAATDQLRKDTQLLINQTKTEFDTLSKLTEETIVRSLDTINQNINSILNYAANRTNDLVTFLLEDITAAQKYQIDYSNCMITKDFIQSLPTNFELRYQLSTQTALRVANSTIRLNVATMERMIRLLNTYDSSLGSCQDTDMDCIIKISTQIVESNDDFLSSFNAIFANIQSLPQLAITQATNAANRTVYEDEDYVCENADLVKTCIETYNEDAANDGTTIQPDSTITTTLWTTTTPTPTTVTQLPTTVGPTENPTTKAPLVYCNHEPFNPVLFF